MIGEKYLKHVQNCLIVTCLTVFFFCHFSLMSELKTATKNVQQDHFAGPGEEWSHMSHRNSENNITLEIFIKLIEPALPPVIHIMDPTFRFFDTSA
jgi:hypothetical protein